MPSTTSRIRLEGKDNTGRAFRSARKNIDGVGSSALITKQRLAALAGAAGFAAITKGLGSTIRAAANWEAALVGVQKTTNATAAEMKIFDREIRALEKSLPFAGEEIANVAAQAAQLGIRGTKNIVGFARTIKSLETATTITGEMATELARFIKLSGESTKNVEKLGSVFVELGNNFALTESELLGLSFEIARGSAAVGNFAANEMTALAAALAEAGTKAEVAASTVQQFWAVLTLALKEGGDNLQRFVEITGMSEAALNKAFDERPVEVLEAFARGLSKYGRDQLSILKSLDLGGRQYAKTLISLAKNSDTFTDAILQSNTAYGEGSALAKELGLFLDTLSAQYVLTENAARAMTREIGKRFAQAAKDSVVAARGFFGAVENNADAAARAIAGLLGAVAGFVAYIAGGAAIRAILGFKAALLGVAAAARTARIGITLFKAVSIIGLPFLAAELAIANMTESLDDQQLSAAGLTEKMAGLGAEIEALERKQASASNTTITPADHGVAMGFQLDNDPEAFQMLLDRNAAVSEADEELLAKKRAHYARLKKIRDGNLAAEAAANAEAAAIKKAADEAQRQIESQALIARQATFAALTAKFSDQRIELIQDTDRRATLQAIAAFETQRAQIIEAGEAAKISQAEIDAAVLEAERILQTQLFQIRDEARTREFEARIEAEERLIEAENARAAERDAAHAEARAIADEFRIAEIERELGEFEARREREILEHEERKARILELQAFGVMTNALEEQAQAEHSARIVAINADEAAAKKKIARDEKDAKIDAARSAVDAIGQFGSKSFKVAKISAIANAIINTHEAISKANSLPFPLNIAEIARAAATGFAAVRSIKSTNRSGGGGATTSGSSSTSSASAPVAPAAPAPRPVNITFTGSGEGRGFDDPAEIERIVAAVLESAAAGGFTIAEIIRQD